MFCFMFTPDILMDNQSNRKYQIDGDLHINSVHRNDSGYYSCAWNQPGKLNHHAEISNIIKLQTICK